MLSDTLLLGLFVGGSLCVGLGLGLGRLFGLFTLDLGVLGGVPGIKDLLRDESC